VREGLARTGRVITAAAAVMVVVFASFAAGEDRVLKLFGISLAVAVLMAAGGVLAIAVRLRPDTAPIADELDESLHQAAA
jgi:uncharacterized membrane protein YdfJ with MMPL/SSD domain